MADKPKKHVEQKTLDMLAKGRAIRDAKRAAAKTASPAPAPSTTPTKKTDKPTTPTARPARCTTCWNRPCDKSGKRCVK